VLEIDIDVGRLVAFLGDEALEQKVNLAGVDLGDLETIADGGIGGRTAALAEDILRAGKADDVIDGQKIGGVVELLDQPRFMGDGFHHLLRRAAGVALPEAYGGELFERLLRGQRLRPELGEHRRIRILVAQLVERKADA